MSARLLSAILLFGLNAALLLWIFNFGFNLWFYLPVACLSLVLSFIYPAGGLMGVLALVLVFASQYTLQPVIIDRVVYKLFLIDPAIIGVLGGLLFSGLKRLALWRPDRRDALLIIFLFLILIYAAISLSIGQGSFNLVISSLKNYAFYPLIFFAGYLAFDSQEKRRELLAVAFWSVCLILLFLIYGIMSGKGLWTDITPLTTQGSRLLDFNHAFYLSLATIVGFTAMVYGRSRRIVTGFAYLLPLFILGVAVSLMRHLWLSGMAAAIAFLWLVAKSKLSQTKKLILGFALAGAALLALLMFAANLFPDATYSRRVMIGQRDVLVRAASLADSGDTSILWRSRVWQALWNKYENNILFGIGFGQKVFVEMPDYLDYVEVRNIHNSFLALLVQIGLLPFLLFVWFIVSWTKKLIKAGNKGNHPYPVALIVVLVFCVTAFNFQPYLEANFFNYIFWLTLGFGRRIYENPLG